MEGDTSCLKRGDCVRLGDAHYLKDWSVSHDPLAPCSSNKFTLSRPYSHYKAHNDYPSKHSDKKGVDESVESKWSFMPLWKLIPQKKYKRKPWRIQYDNGDVPCLEEEDFIKPSSDSIFRSTHHFNVFIPWKTVECSCKDIVHDPEHISFVYLLVYTKI